MTCDPGSGGGCTGSDRCVWSVNGSSCLPRASTAVGHLAECDPSAQNCARGFSCLPVSEGNVCFKLCHPGSDVDCAGLRGPVPTFACGTILPNSVVAACEGDAIRCSVLADRCPAGSHCDTDDAHPICLTDGPKRKGERCSFANERCGRGLVCVSADGVPTCLEPCDFNNTASCPAAGESCSAEVRSAGGLGQGFGICWSSSPSSGCNPLLNGADCPSGQSCQIEGMVSQCEPEGSGGPGESCGSGFSCRRGSVCANLGDGFICRVPCSASAPCASGQCVPVFDEPWGVCY